MTKKEFDNLKFSYEILPSGNINVSNKFRFTINGSNTICCWGGIYTRTTSYKSLNELLEKAKDFYLI